MCGEENRRHDIVSGQWSIGTECLDQSVQKIKNGSRSLDSNTTCCI